MRVKNITVTVCVRVSATVRVSLVLLYCITVSVRVSVMVRVSLVFFVSSNIFGASSVSICRRCVYKILVAFAQRCVYNISDAKLFRHIVDPDDNCSLQKGIDALQSWSQHWLLKLNISKCNVVSFGLSLIHI